MKRGNQDHFIDALKELRSSRAASLREMAKEFGFSASYLHELEKGTRNPSVRNTVAIVRFIRNTHGRVSEEYWHTMAARTHGWEV